MPFELLHCRSSVDLQQVRKPAPTLRHHALASALLAAAVFSGACAIPAPSRAQDSAIYTISNNDGYGIADCMLAGSACGRVMADSWCEAKGHAHALSFGSSEDVTGAIGGAERHIRVAAGDVVIRCGD